MRFSRLFLNRLQNQPPVADTVVVIDVLRSFTTAAVALARGATAVYPVEAMASVSVLRERLPSAVTVGAIRGGEPVPGFDFGNSPSALLKADLAGRPVILSTAAGVRGLQHFRHVQRLYAASLVCAKATAEAIQAAGAEEVCFIITGEWVDRDGDEDVACADYLEALLSGKNVAPEPYEERVRASDFGRRFLAQFSAEGSPYLPKADLELAAQADLYDFALPVCSEGNGLVIR
jgi:2-phosphosulfolactate phosphatase